MYTVLPERNKKEETELERSINNLMDRGVITALRLKALSKIEDFFDEKIMPESKEKQLERRIKETQLALLRKQLNPNKALVDEFVEEEGGLGMTPYARSALAAEDAIKNGALRELFADTERITSRAALSSSFKAPLPKFQGLGTLATKLRSVLF